MNQANRYFIHALKMLILFSAILTLAPTASVAAAGWADLVKSNIYKENPRTLKGKAFLDKPIVDATVLIYDQSGALLCHTDSRTGEDGSFSLTQPLPKSFLVVIRDGLLDGEIFDHEVTRYINDFNEDKFYKINAITTLTAEYISRYPDMSFTEAEKAVANYLSIPESVNINEVIYSSEWYCYLFSHYHFMNAAQKAGGFTFFIKKSCDQLEAGNKTLFSAADTVGSSMFKGAMESLAKGALSYVGGAGAGWVLGLLFPDNSATDMDSRLDEMQDDLNQILNDLNQVIGLLNDLANQLQIDTTEVETYIQGMGAQDAITTIKDHFGPDTEGNNGSTNTLKYFSSIRSSTNNDTTRALINTLVNNINGAWDIETQVQTIHDTILSDVGNDSGLLDLWTTNFLLQGHVDDDRLMNYYKTLEQYFSVLLLYQFKGANLVVEAMNYELAATSATAQNTPTPAASYLDGFKQNIKEETDNFLKNVARLIVNNSGLYSESSFLPANAQEILARANWFVIQTLGPESNDYGFRVACLGTGNLLEDTDKTAAVQGTVTFKCFHASLIRNVESKALDESQNMCELFTVQGRPYDAWSSDLKSLKSDDSYILLNYDFGSLNPPDDLLTTLAGFRIDGNSKGTSFQIKKYTEDFIEDPNGEISYAFALVPFRRGGWQAVMDESAFVEHFYKQDRYTGYHDATGVDWWTDRYLDGNRFHLWLHGEFTNYNVSLEGYGDTKMNLDAEWYHRFTFTGTERVAAHLLIDKELLEKTCTLKDDTKFCTDSIVEIGYRIGLYDATHKKFVKDGEIVKEIKKTHKPTKCGSKCETWPEKRNNVTLSFNLEPGHEYYVYARGWGKGQYNWYEYKLDMNVRNLTLTFVDSEF